MTPAVVWRRCLAVESSALGGTRAVMRRRSACCAARVGALKAHSEEFRYFIEHGKSMADAAAVAAMAP